MLIFIFRTYSTPLERCQKGMKVFFAKFLRLFACIFLFVAASHAEKGILVVHVGDTQGQSMEGVEVAATGSSESGRSDRWGRLRIKLDPNTKVGAWLHLEIVSAHKGKELVLISPWDRTAQVPSFDDESSNVLQLVVAPYGDRHMLENHTAVTSIAARVNNESNSKAAQDTVQQHKEALETTAKALGLSSNDLDKAIHSLGGQTNDPYEKGLAVLYEKNYPLASQLFLQSLSARERKLNQIESTIGVIPSSEQSKELSRAKSSTADAAFFLGQSKHSECKYRESTLAYQKVLVLKPEDSSAMVGLGTSVFSAGDVAGAEPLLRRALAIDEKTLGPDHPSVSRDLNMLGLVLREKKDQVGAEGMFRRALAIDQKAHGTNHPDVARDLSNLGLALKERGNLVEAESLQRRAVAIQEKMTGPNSADTAGVLGNLASVLDAEGDHWSAEPLFRRALAIDEKSLGPNVPIVAIFLNNLALILKNRGDFSDAEPMYRRALAISEKVLGHNHPTTRLIRNNLAALLRQKPRRRR
jgi:tetratricopeptide (TPR) repeat protein